MKPKVSKHIKYGRNSEADFPVRVRHTHTFTGTGRLRRATFRPRFDLHINVPFDKSNRLLNCAEKVRSFKLLTREDKVVGALCKASHLGPLYW
jgi:hypothetical protein